MFAALIAMTWATGAAAVTPVAACGVLGSFGETYNVTTDITACGDCLIVGANRITIDLQGNEITQDIGCFTGSAVTDLGVARDQIIVKNGSTFSDSIGSFEYGINLAASTRTEVRDIVTHDNSIYGILVTRNIANDNLEEGIVTGGFCVVTFNTANGNGDDGIDVSAAR